MRTLAIGLDGCSWNVLEPLLATGELPHLSELCERGAFGVLESTVPFYTGPAWASFATGSSPASHGVYDFMMLREDGRLSVANQSDLRRVTYYQQLGREGKRSVLINMPLDQDGCEGAVIVNSWLTVDEERRIFPTDRVRRYSQALERYRSYPTTFGEERARHVADLCDLEERRFELARELLLAESWDHFFVLFSSTDWLAHEAAGAFLDGDPGARDAYLQLYRRLDGYVGWLVGAAPDALVVVLSDHGQCHERYAVHVNRVLRDRGLVTLRGEGVTHRTVTVPRSLRHLPIARVGAPAARRARHLLRTRLGTELLTPRRAIEIDRLRSRAFMPTVASYAVHGLELSAAEINGIKRALLEVRLPDGRPAIDGAWSHEELYGKPPARGAPALLFAPAVGVRPSLAVDAPAIRAVSRPGRGAHQRDGILVLAGPGVRPGELNRTSLYDVAPTIAWTMESAIPAGGEGRVLYEAFEPAFVSSRPTRIFHEPARARASAENSEEATAAVAERLKALGYI